jgi:hypothetical protein
LLIFPKLRLKNDAKKPIWMEYAIVDLWGFEQYQSVFDGDRDQLDRSIKAIQRMLERQQYGLLHMQDGVLFLQHKATSDEGAIAQWQIYQKDLQNILNIPSSSLSESEEQGFLTQWNF